MSRKIAREIAFQVIFSTNFQIEKGELEELINELIKEKDIKKHELAEDIKYIEDVVYGTISNHSEIDKKIESNLKGWAVDRIAKTDLAILRLAVYEILYRNDIPYKVSINEAIEISKLFCDDSSPSFINGILASIVNEISNV